MTELVRLSRSCLGKEEKLAVCQTIDEGYLGMGQQVFSFEKELEEFFNNKTKVACVNTGTSALQLALQACGIGVDDEVIIPSITYVASFQSTSALGAKPIACDIDLSTGCMNIDAAKAKITNKTKAIMYVHYASGVGARDDVFELAKQYNLRVIEDAAHSFGGEINNQRIGEEGDVICFSFDGIKNITCGEGGAIVSRDQSVIEKVRDLRLLAVKKDSDQRSNGQRSWEFDIDEQGWRYHMSNINAAVGREQLKKIAVFADKRRSLAKLYREQLEGVDIKFLEMDLINTIPHIFPIIVPKKRDKLKEFLIKNNIETGIHYKPNHLLTKYLSDNCPVAEYYGASTLSLPLHVSLLPTTILHIVTRIKDFFKNG